MRNLKKIAAALLATLTISGIAVGTFAAYSPSAVIAHTSNQPGEYDAG